MQPIQIKSSFKKDGFDFTLIQREGLVCLFEKSKETHKCPGFEVVILQIHKPHTFPNGETSPLRESLPPSESWGTYGWSYPNLTDAKNRFNSTLDSLKE